jgi:probable phosphoglycerate mutase
MSPPRRFSQEPYQGPRGSTRIRRAVERIAVAHPGARVVAFSHAGAIAEALAQATGSRPFAFLRSDNTAIARLILTPGRWMLRGFNDTAHLET